VIKFKIIGIDSKFSTPWEITLVNENNFHEIKKKNYIRIDHTINKSN